MNPYLLEKKIADCLVPALAALPLAVRQRTHDADPERLVKAANGLEFVAGEMRPCAIFIGSMPPTANEAVSAAPFLVIQALDGEDDGGRIQNIRVALRLCVVGNGGEEAESDLFALLSQVRLALMELPGGSLGQFRLLPFGGDGARLPWERPDEQVPPFLQAHVFSNWQTAGAAMRPALNMVDYE